MKEIKYGIANEDELIELCPVCGHEYVHVGDTTFPAKEAVPKDEWDDLRNAPDVRIHFWGECDHKWIKEWHTFKGNTFIRVYVIKEEQII